MFDKFLRLAEFKLREFAISNIAKFKFLSNFSYCSVYKSID